jgi:hypothetical protein
LPPYDARPLHQPHQLLHHFRHRRAELRLRLQKLAILVHL